MNAILGLLAIVAFFAGCWGWGALQKVAGEIDGYRQGVEHSDICYKSRIASLEGALARKNASTQPTCSKCQKFMKRGSE